MTTNRGDVMIVVQSERQELGIALKFVHDYVMGDANGLTANGGELSEETLAVGYDKFRETGDRIMEVVDGKRKAANRAEAMASMLFTPDVVNLSRDPKHHERVRGYVLAIARGLCSGAKPDGVNPNAV